MAEHPMEARAAKVEQDYPCQILPARSIFARAGEDLTVKASLSGRQTVFGREAEVDALITALVRRYRNNVVLVGDPGVGKTVLMDHLAWRIVNGDVPHPLRQWKVCRTSFTELWGLVGEKDQPWPAYQALLLELVRECSSSPILLFLDEIHMVWLYVVSRNTLKGPISEGRLRIVGATTGHEFQRYFKADRAFERRFQAVQIDPPDDMAMQKITCGVAKGLADQYDVRVPDDVCSNIVVQSDSYIFNRCRPDRTLDLLEAAAVVARESADAAGREGTVDVSVGDVMTAVSRLTGIEASYLGNARTRLENLALRLKERVQGQDDVCDQVAERLLVTKMRLDLNPNRPDGVFLFAGPTGVGKTELARAIAEAMTGSTDHFLKLDMGNYKDAGSLTLLTGQSRSAHSGDEPEPSILTRFAQEHPFGVILVDEIEKAHPEVLHLFLSILDDGTFRDRHGFVTSFSFTTIILTSNLGHHDKSGAVGFAKGGMSGKALATEQKTRALDVIRASLPREFIGRLDDVFIFNQLSPAVMAALIRRRVVRMGDVLGIGITLTPEQIDKVIQHTVATGLGARALDRLVEKLVGVPVARMKLRGEIRQGQEVRIELS